MVEEVAKPQSLSIAISVVTWTSSMALYAWKGLDGHGKTVGGTRDADGPKALRQSLRKDGVFIIDFATFKEVGFINTGKGTHGIYPSRDGKKMYVANRGSHKIHGARAGPGSVSVVDFATEKVEAVQMLAAMYHRGIQS